MNPQQEVRKRAVEVTETLIGFGVLAFQRAQVERRQLEKKVKQTFGERP